MRKQTFGEILIGIDYRPCYVNGHKGLFHTWAVSEEQWAVENIKNYPNLTLIQDMLSQANTPFPRIPMKSAHTVGIVEFENGAVEECIPSAIKFADHGAFREFAWETERDGGSNAEAEA